MKRSSVSIHFEVQARKHTISKIIELFLIFLKECFALAVFPFLLIMTRDGSVSAENVGKRK